MGTQLSDFHFTSHQLAVLTADPFKSYTLLLTLREFNKDVIFVFFIRRISYRVVPPFFCLETSF